MVPHTDKTGLCSYEEWAHAASWISLMYSLICTDSNQLSWISLKWFVWFMSHDNFLGCCLDPRAQLIINPGCSGQICHSVTSSASKRHTGVTDHHALSESCPQDVPVGNFRRPWQTNIGGVIQQPLFYEPGPPLLPLPPMSIHSCLPPCSSLLLTSSVVCTLTPLPPPTPSSAGPLSNLHTTINPLFPVWAQPLFVEASMWGMCCDCAGLEKTDVPFVARLMVRWYLP